MIELSGYEFRRDADGDWMGSIHSGHEILFRPAAETLSVALDEIERLQQAISEAVHKLSCVSIERDCKGVPEIVRICDNQAIGILLEATKKARKP